MVVVAVVVLVAVAFVLVVVVVAHWNWMANPVTSHAVVVPAEVDDLLQHGRELDADGGVDVGEERALHAGEDAVPGHAGHHVDVHRVLPHTGRGQGQDLGGLASASAVAHVKEHLLRSEQRGLHAVLVET